MSHTGFLVMGLVVGVLCGVGYYQFDVDIVVREFVGRLTPRRITMWRIRRLVRKIQWVGQSPRLNSELRQSLWLKMSEVLEVLE